MLHELFFLQVAHFYNTIDRQMIPSQQPMMLDAALAFESIIKNPKAGAKTNSEVTGSDGTCTKINYGDVAMFVSAPQPIALPF